VIAVLDTSFLIALAKIDQLQLLAHLHSEKLVPRGVVDEVKLGRRKGAPEAETILEALQRLGVQTRKVQAESVDEAVLSLARKAGAELYTNDNPLRTLAHTHGLSSVGPPDFLFLLLCQEVLSWAEYQRLIGELARKGEISREELERYLNVNVRGGG